MIVANSQREHSALGPATRSSLVPRDIYSLPKTSRSRRFLDRNHFEKLKELEQRNLARQNYSQDINAISRTSSQNTAPTPSPRTIASCDSLARAVVVGGASSQDPTPTPAPSLRSIASKNSSQDTIVAHASPTITQENKVRPEYKPIHAKYVPIRLTREQEAQLRTRPPTPTSPQSSFFIGPSSDSGKPASTPTQARPTTEAELPPEASRCVYFPPTPPQSAENTPRVSFKLPPKLATSTDSTPWGALRSKHSCEPFIIRMSRPTTSGSRASTVDSNASALSPEQSYDDRFNPASSSYLTNMNSSSESSLNQALQDAPNHAQYTNGPRQEENTSASSAGSPQLGSQTPANATSTTNLSGLVCNVHKCTGKEPRGLVGATTTILGDKLYVFGGRVLSRKRPYLTSDIFELDLIKRHWTKLQARGDIPGPRYFHSICPLGDTKLICYGGMSPAPSQTEGEKKQQTADPNGEMIVMSDIHVFDAPSRTWTHISTADTPPGRYAHCAAVLPSTAVFSSSNAPLSAILHNPPSSLSPNQGSLGVTIDGSGGSEMIVVGGQDTNNKYIDAVSVFNLRSLRWTDTQSLPRSCGAYRSVVTPLTGLSPLKVGTGPDQQELPDGANGATEKVEPTTSMLIYSNYNFQDVKLELQVRMPNGSLVEKSMMGPVSPPGLRFPNGDVFDNHFIVSGTYLTSSRHEYALWALDLRSLEWSRIDAGGGIFSQGSWNRGILWARRNTFVILGNRKRSLVDDYHHRRINFSNICMVELEAFGLYDNPRRLWPTSNYTSVSSPVLPPTISHKHANSDGRPLSSAAVELGAMAMNIRDLADMDLVAISGEKIPVNSYVLSRRWGPYFVKLLRDSISGAPGILHSDTASSSDGGTLRPGTLNASASLASRNSSITITPSVTTSHSIAPSSITALSSNSGSTTTGLSTTFDPPTPQNLPASARPRQLYLPHTLLTLRALVHYLYTSSLPASNHHLCTPQILCSLLQLARPYCIDGLLEATVERLHQILDGRNAAAVFNAAAMAAGGGRGTGAMFGKEEEDAVVEGLTITKLQARNAALRKEVGSEPISEASESEVSSSSVTSTSEDSGAVADEGVWSGDVSCVVGLQKRGLRGLMEGRRIREKERGRAVGGLESPTPGLNNGVNGDGHSGLNGVGAGGSGGREGGGVGAVGLGIA